MPTSLLSSTAFAPCVSSPSPDDLDLSLTSRTVDLMDRARSHVLNSPLGTARSRKAVDELIMVLMYEYHFRAAHIRDESDHVASMGKLVFALCLVICCFSVFVLLFCFSAGADGPYHGLLPT